MQVYKEGIEKTIRDSEWPSYKERGYVQINAVEEQPEQEEVEVVADYVISKPKPKAKPKTKAKKK